MSTISKYSFGTDSYLLPKTPDKEQKTYAPQVQQPKQTNINDVFVKKPKNGKKNFWERNLAAILGITSIGFLGITILNGIATHRALKGQGVKGLGDKLDYRSVFTNYKDDANIPFLKDLPGMREVKESFLERIIYPKRNPEIYKNWGAGKANGALLYGPPGTGKTFATKVLAKTLDADVAEISIQKEGSAFVNQAAKNIGNKFDFIFQFAEANPEKQFVISIEEIDGIGKSRGGINEQSSHLEVVNTLLTCFDKAKKYSNITIVANTNNDHLLDEALKDRLPVRIKIDNPDKETIEHVLKYHLKNIAAADEFDVSSVVERLAGFSNRKIEQIVQLALSKGASRQMADNTQTKLTQGLFEEAINEFEETKTKVAFTEKIEELSDPFEDFMGNWMKSMNDMFQGLLGNEKEKKIIPQRKISRNINEIEKYLNLALDNNPEQIDIINIAKKFLSSSSKEEGAELITLLDKKQVSNDIMDQITNIYLDKFFPPEK
jgi:ATP-dependent 26S proteasome regulatory subunit